MRCIACVAGRVVLALLTAGPAAAAPYWVAWEGNDYPENEGWLREGGGPLPTRALGGGTMTLDSLSSTESRDFYRMYDIANPEPGEEFVAQWRLKVDAVDWDNPIFPFDPGVFIYTADGWQAGFVIAESVFEHYEAQTEVTFAPGMFHTWELRSTDMRTFSLAFDGAPVYSGSFVPSGVPARVSWGDIVPQTTSRAQWDYFRFGVIPEPSTGTCLIFLGYLLHNRRFR